MAATVAGFKAAHPEFAGSRADLDARLAAVELRVSDTFGALRDEVVYLELADSLSNSPDGRRARKQDESGGGSIYAIKLKQLRETHAIGRRLAYVP